MKYFDIHDIISRYSAQYKFYDISTGHVFAEITYSKYFPFSYTVLEEYNIIRDELKYTLIKLIKDGGEMECGVYSFDRYIKPLFRNNILNNLINNEHKDKEFVESINSPFFINGVDHFPKILKWRSIISEDGEKNGSRLKNR